MYFMIIELHALVHGGLMVASVTGFVVTVVYRQYDIAKVFNILCVLFMSIHLAYVQPPVLYKYIVSKFNLFFVYKSHITLLYRGMFVLLIIVPYYCVFYFFNPSEHLNKVFLTGLSITVSFIILQIVTLCLFFFNFNKQRLKLWKDIGFLEDALSFHDSVKNHVDITDGQSIEIFVKNWLEKTDFDIIEGIPSKAASLYDLFKQKMDSNHDDIIGYEEFRTFASSHNVVDVDILWNILCEDNQISKKQLQNLLYNLSFSRKRFANMIHTDYIIVSSLMTYISGAVLGGCFVLITRIWNYNYTFTDGIDMFKLYILVLSYLSGTLMKTIRFLILMITYRPFNIGDILLIQGKTYKLTYFCPTYCHFYGDTFMTISNDALLEEELFNLTSELVYDYVNLQLPLVFPDCTKEIQTRLKDYAHENKWEIDEASIYCGWNNVINDRKVFQCYWKYTFRVHDRIRFNWVRIKVCDFLVQCLTEQLSKSALVLQAACSGAYNDKIKLE